MILILPSPRKRNEDPTLMQRSSDGLEWIVADTYRCYDNGTPKPHTICSNVADAYATDADTALTLHELRAIVNLMVIRITNRPFRECHLHPVSPSILP